MLNSKIAHMQFPADKSQMGETLSALRKYIAELSKTVGLESQAMYHLQLAADEIATNIIVYGYQDLPGQVIDVTAAADDKALTLVIEDKATPFNPLDRPEPNNLDSPLDTREIGGLGVYLAIQNVDEYKYEHDGVHNRNIFIMKRPSAAS